MIDTLSVVLAAIAAARSLIALKAPPAPKGDEYEKENTYGLPTGANIAAELRRWFEAQLADILGGLAAAGAGPDGFPAFVPPDLNADYDGPMAEAMTPLVSAYWDEAGREVRERLGLDPATWTVVDPKTQDEIHRLTLTFCHATNATTTLQLGDALNRLKDELAAGIVDRGESVAQLTERVKNVFTLASDHRARRIAQTETSRAVHQAKARSASSIRSAFDHF